jgi:hypothetical protein
MSDEWRDMVAGTQQAEYFLALLDQHRAELCEHLKAQPERRAIEALVSELRMIDRMCHALRVRLGLPTLDPALRTTATQNHGDLRSGVQPQARRGDRTAQPVHRSQTAAVEPGQPVAVLDLDSQPLPRHRTAHHLPTA